MTDLRKAAELALNYFENAYELDSHEIEIREALRQALAQPEQDELLKQGWRQCAVGQRTTQYCGIVEQKKLEERETCAKICEELFMSDGHWCAKAIRARGDK